MRELGDELDCEARAFALDDVARDAGVALLPGVGFDPPGTLSPGTAATVVSRLRTPETYAFTVDAATTAAEDD